MDKRNQFQFPEIEYICCAQTGGLINFHGYVIEELFLGVKYSFTFRFFTYLA